MVERGGTIYMWTQLSGHSPLPIQYLPTKRHYLSDQLTSPNTIYTKSTVRVEGYVDFSDIFFYPLKMYFFLPSQWVTWQPLLIK